MTGFPAILIGGYLRIFPIKRGAGRFLLVASILMLVAEIAIARAAGWHASGIQFFISTFPMAAALLCVALAEKQIAPASMASIGRNESLGIYLYHPFAIYISASIITGQLRASTEGTPGVLTWVLAAFLTRTGLYMLKKVLPRLREVLDGKFLDDTPKKSYGK